MDERLSITPPKPQESISYLSRNKKMMDNLMPVHHIVSVDDGDTFDFYDHQGNLKTSRWHGIDTPEKLQTGGQESKAFLQKFIDSDYDIRTKGIGVGYYGRTLGQHYVDDKKGNIYDLNHIMVIEGYAHASTFRHSYGTYDQYNKSAEEARRKKIGMYRHGTPQNPSLFRKYETFKDSGIYDSRADYASIKQQRDEWIEVPEIDLSKYKPLSKTELNMTARGFRRQYELPTREIKEQPKSISGSGNYIAGREAMPYYSIEMPASYFEGYKNQDYIPYISQFENLYTQRMGEEPGLLRSMALRSLDHSMSRPSLGISINRKLGFEYYKQGQGLVGSTISSIGRAIDNLFGQQEYNDFEYERKNPDKGTINRLLKIDHAPDRPEGGGNIEHIMTTAYEVAKGTAVAIGTYIGINLPFQHLLSSINETTMNQLFASTKGRSEFVQNIQSIGQQINLGRSFGLLANLATTQGKDQAEVAQKFVGYITDVQAVATNKAGAAAIDHLKDEDLKKYLRSMLTDKGWESLQRQVLRTDTKEGSIILGDSDELSLFKAQTSFRKFDAARFNMIGRPILDAINPFKERASVHAAKLDQIFKVSVDELEQTLKLMPTLVFPIKGADANRGMTIQYKNIGPQRVRELAKSLDRVGELLPANLAYWVPGLRQTLKLNDFNPTDNMTWRDLFSLEEATERVSYAMKSVSSSIGLQWQTISPGFDDTTPIGQFRRRAIEFKQTMKHMYKSTKETLKEAYVLHKAGREAKRKSDALLSYLGEVSTKDQGMINSSLKGKKAQDLLEDYKRAQTTLTNKYSAYSSRIQTDAFQSPPNPLSVDGTKDAVLSSQFTALGAKDYSKPSGENVANRKAAFKKGLLFMGGVLLTDAALDFAFMKGGANLFQQVFARQALIDEEGEDIARFKFQGTAPTTLVLGAGLATGAAAGYLMPSFLAEADQLTIPEVLSSRMKVDPRKYQEVVKAIGTPKMAQLKFNKGAAWAGAIAGIFAAKMAFKAGAGILNTLYGHDSGIELDTEGGILNQLLMRKALEAQEDGMLTNLRGAYTTSAVLEDLAFNSLQGPGGESRMYNMATQFTLPFFQVSALARIDTQKDLINMGVGFQLAPVLGLGLSPMLPVALKLTDRDKEYFEELEGENMDFFTSTKFALKTGADIMLGGQNLVYSKESGFKDSLMLIGAGSFASSVFTRHNRNTLLRTVPKSMRGGLLREFRTINEAANSAIPRTLGTLTYNTVRNITTLPFHFASSTYKAMGSKGAAVLMGATALYSLSQVTGELQSAYKKMTRGEESMSSLAMGIGFEAAATVINTGAFVGTAAALSGRTISPRLAGLGKAAIPYYLGLTAARIISQPGTSFDGYEVKSTDEHIAATMGIGLATGFLLQQSGAFASQEELVNAYLAKSTKAEVKQLLRSVSRIPDEIEEEVMANFRGYKMSRKTTKGFLFTSRMGLKDAAAGAIYSEITGTSKRYKVGTDTYTGRTPKQILNAQSFRRLRGRLTLASAALFGGYMAATAVNDLSTESMRDFLYGVPVLGSSLRVLAGDDYTEYPDARGPNFSKWIGRMMPGSIADMIGIYKDNPDPFFQATTMFGQSFKDTGVNNYFQVASTMTDLSVSSYAIASPAIDNGALLRLMQRNMHKNALGVLQTYRGRTQRKQAMRISEISNHDLRAASSMILRDIRIRQFKQEWLKNQRPQELQMDLLTELYGSGQRGSAMLPDGVLPTLWSPLRSMEGQYIVNRFINKQRKTKVRKGPVQGINQYIDDSYYKDRLLYQTFGGAGLLANLQGYLVGENKVAGAIGMGIGFGIFGLGMAYTLTQGATALATMAREKEAGEVIEAAVTTKQMIAKGRYKFVNKEIDGVNRLVQIDLGRKGKFGVVAPEINLDDLASKATKYINDPVQAKQIAQGFETAHKGLIASLDDFYSNAVSEAASELAELNLSTTGSTAQVETFRNKFRKTLDEKLRNSLKNSLNKAINDELTLTLGKALGFGVDGAQKVDDIVDVLLGDLNNGGIGATAYVDDLLDDMVEVQTKYSNQFIKPDFDPDDFRIKQRVRLGDARFGASTRRLFDRLLHPVGSATTAMDRATSSKVKRQVKYQAETARRAKLYNKGIYADKAWSEGFLRETGYVARGSSSLLMQWLTTGKTVYEGIEGLAIGLDQSNPELLRSEGYANAIRGGVNTATAMAMTGVMTVMGLGALPALAISVALMIGVEALKNKMPGLKRTEDRLYDKLGNLIIDPSGALEKQFGQPGKALGTILEYAGAIPAGILSAIAKPFSFIAKQITAPFIMDAFQGMEDDPAAVQYTKGFLLPTTAFTKDWMRRAQNAQYVKDQLKRASSTLVSPDMVHPFLLGRASSEQDRIHMARYFKSYAPGGRILQDFSLGSYRVSNLMLMELKRRQQMYDLTVTGSMAKRLYEPSINPIQGLATLGAIAATPFVFNKLSKTKLAKELAQDAEFVVSKFSGRVGKAIFGNKYAARREAIAIARKAGINKLPEIELDIDSAPSYYSKSKGIMIGTEDADILARLNRGQAVPDDLVNVARFNMLHELYHNQPLAPNDLGERLKVFKAKSGVTNNQLRVLSKQSVIRTVQELQGQGIVLTRKQIGQLYMEELGANLRAYDDMESVFGKTMDLEQPTSVINRVNSDYNKVVKQGYHRHTPSIEYDYMYSSKSATPLGDAPSFKVGVQRAFNEAQERTIRARASKIPAFTPEGAQLNNIPMRMRESWNRALKSFSSEMNQPIRMGAPDPNLKGFGAFERSVQDFITSLGIPKFGKATLAGAKELSMGGILGTANATFDVLFGIEAITQSRAQGQLVAYDYSTGYISEPEAKAKLRASRQMEMSSLMGTVMGFGAGFLSSNPLVGLAMGIVGTMWGKVDPSYAGLVPLMSDRDVRRAKDGDYAAPMLNTPSFYARVNRDYSHSQKAVREFLAPALTRIRSTVTKVFDKTGITAATNATKNWLLKPQGRVGRFGILALGASMIGTLAERHSLKSKWESLPAHVRAMYDNDFSKFYKMQRNQLLKTTNTLGMLGTGANVAYRVSKTKAFRQFVERKAKPFIQGTRNFLSRNYDRLTGLIDNTIIPAVGSMYRGTKDMLFNTLAKIPGGQTVRQFGQFGMDLIRSGSTRLYNFAAKTLGVSVDELSDPGLIRTPKIITDFMDNVRGTFSRLAQHRYTKAALEKLAAGKTLLKSAWTNTADFMVSMKNKGIGLLKKGYDMAKSPIRDFLMSDGFKHFKQGAKNQLDNLLAKVPTEAAKRLYFRAMAKAGVGTAYVKSMASALKRKALNFMGSGAAKFGLRNMLLESLGTIMDVAQIGYGYYQMSNLNEYSRKAEYQEAYSNTYAGKGSIIGAAIGSFFGPGLGTLVGSVIGGVLGSVYGHYQGGRRYKREVEGMSSTDLLIQDSLVFGAGVTGAALAMKYRKPPKKMVKSFPIEPDPWFMDTSDYAVRTPDAPVRPPRTRGGDIVVYNQDFATQQTTIKTVQQDVQRADVPRRPGGVDLNSMDPATNTQETAKRIVEKPILKDKSVQAKGQVDKVYKQGPPKLGDPALSSFYEKPIGPDYQPYTPRPKKVVVKYNFNKFDPVQGSAPRSSYDLSTVARDAQAAFDVNDTKIVIEAMSSTPGKKLLGKVRMSQKSIEQAWVGVSSDPTFEFHGRGEFNLYDDGTLEWGGGRISEGDKNLMKKVHFSQTDQVKGKVNMRTMKIESRGPGAATPSVSHKAPSIGTHYDLGSNTVHVSNTMARSRTALTEAQAFEVYEEYAHAGLRKGTLQMKGLNNIKGEFRQQLIKSAQSSTMKYYDDAIAAGRQVTKNELINVLRNEIQAKTYAAEAMGVDRIYTPGILTDIDDQFKSKLKSLPKGSDAIQGNRLFSHQNTLVDTTTDLVEGGLPRTTRAISAKGYKPVADLYIPEHLAGTGDIERSLTKAGDTISNSSKYIRPTIQKISSTLDNLGLGWTKKMAKFGIRHMETTFTVGDVVGGLYAESERARLSRNGEKILDVLGHQEAHRQFEAMRKVELNSFMGTTGGSVVNLLTANPLLGMVAGGLLTVYGMFDPTYGGLATRMAEEDLKRAERGEAFEQYTSGGGYYARAHHKFTQPKAVINTLTDEIFGRPTRAVLKGLKKPIDATLDVGRKFLKTSTEKVLSAYGGLKDPATRHGIKNKIADFSKTARGKLSNFYTQHLVGSKVWQNFNMTPSMPNWLKKAKDSVPSWMKWSVDLKMPDVKSFGRAVNVLAKRKYSLITRDFKKFMGKDSMAGRFLQKAKDDWNNSKLKELLLKPIFERSEPGVKPKKPSKFKFLTDAAKERLGGIYQSSKEALSSLRQKLSVDLFRRKRAVNKADELAKRKGFSSIQRWFNKTGEWVKGFFRRGADELVGDAPTRIKGPDLSKLTEGMKRFWQFMSKPQAVGFNNSVTDYLKVKREWMADSVGQLALNAKAKARDKLIKAKEVSKAFARKTFDKFSAAKANAIAKVDDFKKSKFSQILSSSLDDLKALGNDFNELKNVFAEWIDKSKEGGLLFKASNLGQEFKKAPVEKFFDVSTQILKGAKNLITKPAQLLFNNLVKKPGEFLLNNLVKKPGKFLDNKVIKPALSKLADTGLGKGLISSWAKRGSFDMFLDGLGYGVDLYQFQKGAREVIELNEYSSKANYTEAFTKMISARQTIAMGLGGRGVAGDTGELLMSTAYEVANLGLWASGSDFRLKRVDEEFIIERYASGDTGVGAVLEYGVLEGFQDYREGKAGALLISTTGQSIYEGVIQKNTKNTSKMIAQSRRAKMLREASVRADEALDQAAKQMANNLPSSRKAYAEALRRSKDLARRSDAAYSAITKQPGTFQKLGRRLDVMVSSAAKKAKLAIKSEAAKRLDSIAEVAKKVKGGGIINRVAKKLGIEGAGTKIKTLAKKIPGVGTILSAGESLVGLGVAYVSFGQAKKAKTKEEFQRHQQRAFRALYGSTAAAGVSAATSKLKGKAAIAGVAAEIAAVEVAKAAGDKMGERITDKVEAGDVSYEMLASQQQLSIFTALPSHIMGQLVKKGEQGIAVGQATTTAAVQATTELGIHTGQDTKGYSMAKISSLRVGEVGSVLWNNLRGNVRDAWDLVRLPFKPKHRSKYRQERIASRDRRVREVVKVLTPAPIQGPPIPNNFLNPDLDISLTEPLPLDTKKPNLMVPLSEPLPLSKKKEDLRIPSDEPLGVVPKVTKEKLNISLTEPVVELPEPKENLRISLTEPVIDLGLPERSPVPLLEVQEQLAVPINRSLFPEERLGVPLSEPLPIPQRPQLQIPINESLPLPTPKPQLEISLTDSLPVPKPRLQIPLSDGLNIPQAQLQVPLSEELSIPQPELQVPLSKKLPFQGRVARKTKAINIKLDQSKLRFTGDLDFEDDPNTNKPRLQSFTIEGKKVEGYKVRGRNRIYSNGTWYYVRDKLGENTFADAKEVKKEENLKAVKAGDDTFLMPMMDGDWNKTAQKLAKDRLEIVGAVGSGFAQRIDGELKQVGYQYADLGEQGASPEDYETDRLNVAKYRAGYYTTAEGKVKLINLDPEMERGAVREYIKKLKDEGAKSISIQSRFAYDEQRANEKKLVLGESGKTSESHDLEKRGMMAFDSKGDYLGFVASPTIHQSDQFFAAKQVFGDKVSHVVPSDGDMYAQYHLEGVAPNMQVKSFPGAMLIVKKIEEDQGEVKISEQTQSEKARAVLGDYADKVGDVWKRKIKDPAGRKSEELKKSFGEFKGKFKSLTNSVFDKAGKLISGTGEFFFGKAAHAGEIPKHLRYLQPQQTTETKVEVDLRIREEMEDRLKQGIDDEKLPWWKRLGNFAKKVFGQATKFAKNQWNRFFGRDSWVRARFRDVSNAITGGGSQGSGSTTDPNKAERDRSQKIRANLRSALGLETQTQINLKSGALSIAPGAKAVPKKALDKVTSSLGINADMWDLFRNTLATIESGGKYNIKGGSGGHYDGRYQLGKAAKTDGARQMGIKDPGHNASQRVNYRKDAALQETVLAGFTIANHKYLMANSAKYRNASIEKRLEVLAYAHNQGMGGAEKWLRTGQVGADGFGTKGTAYSEAIRDNFRKLKASPDPTPAGEPSGKLDAEKLFSTMRQAVQEGMQDTVDQVIAPGQAIKSGVVTAPKSIQKYTGHHIDLKMYTGRLNIEQRVAIMDQLATTYKGQGEQIKLLAGHGYFKARGGKSRFQKLQDKVWDPNWDMATKKKWLKLAEDSHSYSKSTIAGRTAIDYQVVAPGQTAISQQGEGAKERDILIPYIPGAKVSFHNNGSSNLKIVYRNAQGQKILEFNHGHTKRGTPKNFTIEDKSNTPNGVNFPGQPSKQDEKPDELKNMVKRLKVGEPITPALAKDVMSRAGVSDEKEKQYYNKLINEYNAGLSQEKQKYLKEIQSGKVADPFKNVGKAAGRMVEDIPTQVMDEAVSGSSSGGGSAQTPQGEIGKGDRRRLAGSNLNKVNSSYAYRQSMFGSQGNARLKGTNIIITSGFGGREKGISGKGSRKHPGVDVTAADGGRLPQTNPFALAKVTATGGAGMIQLQELNPNTKQPTGRYLEFYHTNKKYVKKGQVLEFGHKVGTEGTGGGYAKHSDVRLWVQGDKGVTIDGISTSRSAEMRGRKNWMAPTIEEIKAAHGASSGPIPVVEKRGNNYVSMIGAPEVIKPEQLQAQADMTVLEVEKMIEQKEELVAAMANLKEVSDKVRQKGEEPSKAVVIPSANDLRNGQEDTIRKPMRPTTKTADVVASNPEGGNKTNVIELSDPQKYILSSLCVNDTVNHDTITYNDTISRA